MTRIKRRRAYRLLVPLAVVLAAACSKSDAPATDSAKAAAAASSQPAALVGSAPNARKALPGELTKPIDSYTGDEFYDLVKKLTYVGGKTVQRNCKNDPGCGATKKTAVTVDAVATQDSLAPSTVPQFGVVYIHAVNKGDAQEARYGMLPSRDKYEYYMVITADSAGTAMNWRLEQLDTSPKARQHSSIGTGKFTPCNHTWVAGARADFKTCAGAASSRDSVVHLGLALQGSGMDPMWSSCAAGCCIGD
ncbi:MAG: hypothetical protein ABIY52_14845 [Gemmatimonadaceae bacterium]